MEEFDPARMADLEDVTVGNETILEDFEVLDFRGAVNIISYTVMSAGGLTKYRSNCYSSFSYK